MEAKPTAWQTGNRAQRWVSGSACHFKVLQDGVRVAVEPGRVAGLANDGHVDGTSEAVEETGGDAGLEPKLWWQLYQQDSQLLAELGNFFCKRGDQALDVDEHGLVRDSFWYLHCEAKICWYKGSPFRPCGRSVGAVEGGIYLYRVKDPRVALQRMAASWKGQYLGARDAPSRCAYHRPNGRTTH